jgi:hypothetical protein
MTTWRLNPNETGLAGFLKEFIKRHGIDIKTRRGAARVRAVRALIEAVATNNPDPLVRNYDALEEGDDQAVFALAKDWEASLQRMVNERRPPRRRR